MPSALLIVLGAVIKKYSGWVTSHKEKEDILAEIDNPELKGISQDLKNWYSEYQATLTEDEDKEEEEVLTHIQPTFPSAPLSTFPSNVLVLVNSNQALPDIQKDCEAPAHPPTCKSVESGKFSDNIHFSLFIYEQLWMAHVWLTMPAPKVFNSVNVITVSEVLDAFHKDFEESLKEWKHKYLFVCERVDLCIWQNE
ncbi:hypothetical protein K488DRAFT_75129 [Vararia minispora EC-137]|uniref:Uncharacterized protein n=1 Tax=Vararia minispora EC-137 TaxID=1314806 RepID=A0ACB8Q4P5_9AGAM|nr:hypothetical protein K488DRAFT_75129 [Vararia minispora EC-137]